ncbi:MAG: class II glutamine amidotransferase [Halochromatium sp.]
MCELFAMSSRAPATLGFSLERLARHGGAEGPHRDGWGLAFYEGADCLLLREPRPASESPLMQFMERQGLRTKLGLCHIRLATFGALALRNTQPFARELGGRMHVFAHNGDMPTLADQPARYPARFSPVGDSDSERAFCGLMTELAPIWDAAWGKVPDLSTRLAVIADYARELRALGPANFIYSDSDALFVHADRRTQPEDGQLRAPGLYLLQRCCWRTAPELQDAGVNLCSIRQDVALIASVPLTDELWEPLGEGDLIALRDGLCFGADGRQVEPERVAGRQPLPLAQAGH